MTTSEATESVCRPCEQHSVPASQVTTAPLNPQTSDVAAGHLPLGDRPHSSDRGILYWSSHLPNTQWEKVVPSGHGANEDPEGIEEIRRILRLHLLESTNP